MRSSEGPVERAKRSPAARSRRGASAAERPDGAIVTQLRHGPGPLDNPLDVVAVAIQRLAPAGRLAVLGLAAGSVLAPLRALGVSSEVCAVDIDPTGWRALRRSGAGWIGAVRFRRGDAQRWLEARRGRFAAIFDDLSEEGPEGLVKPWITWHALPTLGRRRLVSSGLWIANLLPREGTPWTALTGSTAAPFPHAVEVRFAGWENRLLVASAAPLSAVRVSRSLRSGLGELGSLEARGIRVRTMGGAGL